MGAPRASAVGEYAGSTNWHYHWMVTGSLGGRLVHRIGKGINSRQNNKITDGSMGGGYRSLRRELDSRNEIVTDARQARSGGILVPTLEQKVVRHARGPEK